LKNPFRKKQKRTAVWLSDPSAYDILCADGYKPLSKNEEIIKCANIIADLVSSMTIMLMKNGENGDVRVKNELSKKIDIYPNKHMTRKNFIFKIAKDLIIGGNSIAIPKVTADGLLDDIQLVDMSKVTFQSDTDSYKIRIGTVDFDPDELLHFVHIPRLDKPFEGEGYKSAIIDTVENLIQANATKKGFLRSKWKPSMVISINSDAEELQDKDKRKAILGSYTDTTEAGEPWIIPAGEIDVKTIQPLTLND
jgi:HK97 family phage portal protein